MLQSAVCTEYRALVKRTKGGMHKEISNVIPGSGPLCLTRCLSRLALSRSNPLPRTEPGTRAYMKQRYTDLTGTFGICSVHTVIVSEVGEVSKPNFAMLSAGDADRQRQTQH